MLAAARHQEILSRIESLGAVQTTELARELGVTKETIRRDLDRLDREHRLIRSHGGAMSLDSTRQDFSQSERETIRPKAKRALAQTAIKLIEKNETIFIDASTTALHCALALPKDLSLRVVTYSLPVIQALTHRIDLELVLLGGTYDPHGSRFTGLLTDESLSLLKIDRFFFSGKGFHLDHGVSEADPRQAQLKRHILRRSLWSCALIDSSKFGLLAPHVFAKPNDFQALITDTEAGTYLDEHLDYTPDFQLLYAS